ncbi:MAG: hypothetical protein ACYTBX_15045 [Planctomycetota bacterium]
MRRDVNPAPAAGVGVNPPYAWWVNGDCNVDWDGFAVFAGNWLEGQLPVDRPFDYT